MTKTRDKLILGILVILLVGMSATFITALTSVSEGEAERIALKVSPGKIEEVEFEDGNYEVDIRSNGREREVTINPQGQVISVEDELPDQPITGNALERASQAALNHVGEGEVTDSEIEDEEGYYEIEITLDNGDEVDVHLDENFNVLSTEYD